MTSHRLVRCPVPRLLEHVAAVHPELLSDAERALLPHWRDRPPLPDRSVIWRYRLPDGSMLGWCLEVEQGANGTLAHLSAGPVTGPATRLPRPLQRLALRTWTDRELAGLARAVEDGDGHRPRAARDGDLTGARVHLERPPAHPRKRVGLRPGR